MSDALLCGERLLLLQAHRLVLLAERSGQAAEAEDLLFQAIYERGQNVADAATLNALGQELGLDGVSELEIMVRPVCKCMHGHSPMHASAYGYDSLCSPLACSMHSAIL